MVVALVALLALVVGVSIAIAAKKVDSFVGSPTGASGNTAGLLNIPRGIAVNQNGTGGATAGDYYIVDSSNHRIVQYRANNTFVRAFGLDVVSSGPDQASEVQWVTVNGTEGTFKLTFGANTTTDLPFNATAVEVQAALNALASVNSGGGSVVVSGGPGDGTGSSPYVVSFNGAPLKGTNVAQMTAASGATPLGGGAGFGANEAKVTTANSGATGYEICDALANPTDVCKAGVTTGGLGGTLSSPQGIAVDQATGNLFVTDSSNRRIQRFSATGIWQRAFGWDTIINGAATGDAANVTTFQICTVMQNCKAGVAGPNAGQFSSSTAGNPATDAAGNLYVPDVGQRRIEKFDSTGAFVSAWGWDVIPNGKPGNVGTGLEACPAGAASTSGDCQAGVQGSGLGQFGSSSPTRVAVDSTGKVYVIDTGNKRVQTFSSTGASPSVFFSYPPGGPGNIQSPTEIAIGAADSVSLAVACPGVNLGEKTSESSWKVACPDATPVADERWIRHYDSSGVLQDVSLKGVGFTVGILGLAANPVTDKIYFSTNSNPFGNRVWTIDNDGSTPPPVATVNPPTELGPHSASFSGTVNPNGPVDLPTSYHFEYSRNGVTWTPVAADVNLGGGVSPVSVPVAPAEGSVSGLEANTFYRVRIVANKAFGAATGISPELTFLTDAVGPEVQTFYPQEYTDSTATLTGEINANNLATTYYFEYGESPAYGSKAPVPDGTTSGGTAEKILAPVQGLESDTTYHYRLVATNSEGTTKGADVVFTTRPSAPVGSSRAYEMVTPAFKATRLSTLVPGASRFDANVGLPSLDGNAMGWDISTLPLTDEVKAPGAGDRRLFERTTQGWASKSMNTLRFVDAEGNPTTGILSQLNAIGSSGDLQTQAWGVTNGAGPGLLPTEGRVPNILYTRREGTGTAGYTPWLANPEKQVFEAGFISGTYVGQTAQASAGDLALFNDAGTAMLRGGRARGLAEDLGTPGDDDPSDDQLLPGFAGGNSAYLVRAADPDDLPGSAKDLIGECTGIGSGSTKLPAREGTGSSATDTIGSQSCEMGGVPAATGTGMRTEDSPTLTGVSTATGTFSVGQIISGTGIPGGTTITAVGVGTLTLSANAKCGPAKVVGNLTNGSPLVTGLKPPSCGTFQVGQTITGTGIPGGTTITDLTNMTLTLSANATVTQFNVALTVPGPALTALTAGGQHVTSRRGMSVGAGIAESSQIATAGVARTALSDDGRRVFFQSPDPNYESAPTSCQTGAGAATDCPSQLYVRQYDSSGVPTVRWISQAQGVGAQQIGEMGRGVGFEGASKDGRYVYFKTNAPLLPGDPNGGVSITNGIAQNTSWDLYRYTLPASHDVDPGPPNGSLERISAGPTGTADPNTNRSTGETNVEPGAGGVVRYLADDGKRAYFVTTSPIAGADVTAPDGGVTVPGGTNGNLATRNLYLFDDHAVGAARWRFIAQLPFAGENPGKTIGDDSVGEPMNACASYSWNLGPQLVTGRDERTMVAFNCFRGTPDGKAVVFFTAAQLTADDDDQAGDIYLYQADTDELVRVTAPLGNVAAYGCKGTRDIIAQPCNGNLSTAGGFFSRGAGQGTAGWHEMARGWSGMSYSNVAVDKDGVVSVFFESKAELIPEDINGDYYDVYQWRNGKLSLISPGSTNHDAWYSGNSLDGRDVFFFTAQRIDPREVDDSDGDVYDARIGGGFPYTPPAAPCDVLGHECRSAVPPPPPAGSAATRSGTSGGNVQQTSRTRKCPAGKVRRKSRCVKKGKRSTSTSGRAGR